MTTTFSQPITAGTADGHHSRAQEPRDAQGREVKASPPSPQEKFSALHRITGTGLAIAIVCAAFAFSAVTLYWAFHHGDDASATTHGNRVVSVVQAGQVQSLVLGEGWHSGALVQTDLGFYVLDKAMSLPKNEALSLETRANDKRYLCDSAHRCTVVL